MAHVDTFKLIKIGELAKRLNMPVTTIRTWADTGMFPTRVRSAHGTRWFDYDEVVDSLDSRKRAMSERRI